LALDDFIDFQTQLEDIHNGVHVWVGGTMGDIAAAAYDPLFWAHHTMIDRLWRMWELRHPHAAPPGALLPHALSPFQMTVSQTIDASSLGYDYAASTASTAGVVERFVSAPIGLSPATGSGAYTRADLIFDEVDHSLASYQARVYINAPEAVITTGRDDPAYAASFRIFGHGGCFGEVGHCDLPGGPRDPFDLRGPQQTGPGDEGGHRGRRARAHGRQRRRQGIDHRDGRRVRAGPARQRVLAVVGCGC
jgi:tyrosinase